MSFYSGFNGKVTVGGSEIRVYEWSGNFSNDWQDTTQTGIPTGGTKAGYKTYTKGLFSADGDFKFYLDGCAIPTFAEGDSVALTLLYNSTDNKGKSMASALIKDMKFDVKVDGKVEVTCDWMAYGEWTDL